MLGLPKASERCGSPGFVRNLVSKNALTIAETVNGC